MISLPQVQALCARGLVGDHHLSVRPGPVGKKNITLIESEQLREFEQTTGLGLSPAEARRNIVTQGIRLNSLLHSEFQVGDVTVLALELCEPCSLLARRTHPEVMTALWHRGGLRCRILADGLIRVGDPITATT